MLLDIHTAMFLAKLLYDVEIDEEDFEEIALICLKQIGNKNTKLQHYVAHIDPEDLSIELPCDCDESMIESVTCEFEDWNYTSNKYADGDYNSLFTETYIEARKAFTDPLYHPGKYAEYYKSGKKLYFKLNYGPVHIVFKGELLDDNGLPFVNDKEIMAIATYVAYVQTFKEGLKTKNGGIIQLAQLLKTLLNIYIDLARTPEYINLNDMDEILDVKTSMNRKVHNHSYKPMIT